MKIDLHYFLLILIFSLISSCQEEESSIIQDTTQNLYTISPVSKLVERVTQNNTSVDDVLDNTSVFKVKLPVSITLNGVDLTVSNEADYVIIKNLKEASNSDDDIVSYTFPILVSLRNYAETTVSSLSQLNDVIVQNEDLKDISCIAFQFPIVINEYDTSNQIANTVTFVSNSQVINYLFNLQPNVYYSFVFPIAMTDSMNQLIIFNSNSELETFIESSIDDCDDGSTTPLNFNTIITTGTWYVSYFYEDGDGDETSDFNGYVFTFYANGTSKVVKSAITVNGTWATFTDSGFNYIELVYDGSDILSEIEEDWKIIEFTETLIRLKHESGGGGGTDYLNFTRN